MSLEENQSVGSDPASNSHSIFSRPRTCVGWWAVGLQLAFLVMFLINILYFSPEKGMFAPWRFIVLAIYGVVMLLASVSGGVLGVIALARHGERSWLVWVSLGPALLVIFFIIAEVISPH